MTQVTEMNGSGGATAYMTVDVEPDCPPFLWTWRGIEEGMPRLLDLFDAQAIKGTFFVTGATAERYPDCIGQIVDRGHELACHGYSHNSFREMDRETARREIERTNAILREFAPVVSFRAPYLQFPEAFLDILVNDGIRIDSSRAAYKWQEKPAPTGSLARLAASVTSSVLRLPRLIRNPWLASLKNPSVLFVHPWEFVDLTATDIRLDCRFRTGEPALRSLETTIEFLKSRRARFGLVRDFAATPAR